MAPNAKYMHHGSRCLCIVVFVFLETEEQLEISLKGTHLEDTPPWMTYSSELDEKLSPKLEEEIAEYSQHRHEKTSTQNEEELCRQREINQEISKEYQWLHPSEYAEEGPRIGRILHSSEFINKLRNKCKLKCWYSDHPQPKKLTLLVQRTDLVAPEVGCWVQFGFMPEYSIVRFDEHGIPLDERLRGWRTCILQLIIKGLLSEDTAHRVFGKAEGPVSDRYNRTLHGFRNTYKG